MEENSKDNIEIPILYEDENCLFINKPAGISVHGDGNRVKAEQSSHDEKTPEYTIADWILEKHPKLAPVGEHLKINIKGEEIMVPKPGIVHRLDKETSGVMLLAKTHEAYEFFKKQFQEREINKTYHCFVYGWPKEDEILVDKPIGRDSGNIRRWIVGKLARGTMREAVTKIKVLNRFGDRPYEGKGSTEEGAYSFVEARPKTGRTHQIRVHLRSINHPIVADSLYAPKREQALGFTRLALHARKLEVMLPGGETKVIEAPYPPDFTQAMQVANIK